MPTLTITNTLKLALEIHDIPGVVVKLAPLGQATVDFVDHFDPAQPTVPTRRDIYLTETFRLLVAAGTITISPPISEFNSENDVVGAGDPVGGFGVNASSATGSLQSVSALYTLDHLNGTTGDGLTNPRNVLCYLSDSGMGIGLTAGTNIANVAIGSPATVVTELVADKLFMAHVPAGGTAPHFKLDVTGDGNANATFWAVLVNPDDQTLNIQALTLIPGE